MLLSQNCSQCGHHHNSTTSGCIAGGGSKNSGGGDGFMLFGVRVAEGSLIRKSLSMNNLSQYQHLQEHNHNPTDASPSGGGYASDYIAGNRHRKKGVPWTEEEHRLFLLGLQRVGKGDWRGISRNYVKTRTPTQVASHAQKYFLRKTNLNRRRRRSSLFDIATTTISTSEEEEQPSSSNQQQLNRSNSGFSLPPADAQSNVVIRLMPPISPLSNSRMESLSLIQKKSKIMDLRSTDLSLKLPTSSSSDQQQQQVSSRSHTVISVA